VYYDCNLVLIPIAGLINVTVSEGVFPDVLKTAKTTALYKSGSKTDPHKYRPISLLPVISKNFEKVIKRRLLRFLNATFFSPHINFNFKKGNLNVVLEKTFHGDSCFLHDKSNSISLG